METITTHDSCDAVIIKNIMNKENQKIKGTYQVECRDAQGKLKWMDKIDNLVTTQGKNLALDTILAGAAYTTTGPFMGLISSIGYSAIVVGDTAASHAGWTEAGATNAPTYTGPRKTCVFGASAVGVKALTTALSFAITSTGTIKGCFIALGTGAVSTIDSTAGVIYSAGLLAGGDKAVANTDVLNISYQASLT
jgi:hypothetical protein